MEGKYIIRTFHQIQPEAEIEEGIGGLVGFPILRNGRRIRLNNVQEELCDARCCQIPQAHNSTCKVPDRTVPWIACDAIQCNKWLHRQCAGVDDVNDEELPRKWFCGCSKFSLEDILE